MDAIEALAENVVKTEYEHLPSLAIDAAKKSILDLLGVILAASTLAPGCKELAQLVKDGGGKRESTVFGFGYRVPSWMAAFVNGAMAHALDYDDLFSEAATHLTSSTAPAAFAIAQRTRKVKGKELLTAIALGQDMVGRLALAMTRSPRGWQLDWLIHSVLGVFGATAAAGKLLKLDKDKLVDALGIALQQASGSVEATKGQLRMFYASFPAKAGVLSSLMAATGITSCKDVLEGQNGLFNLYFAGSYERDALVSELGTRFEGAKIAFKPWPACGQVNPFVDATLEIVRHYDLRPEDVEEVIPVVGTLARRMNCEPWETRLRPPTVGDAKFSLPYALAVTIMRRTVGLGDYTMENIKDPAVLQLAEKVKPRHLPDSRVSGVGPGLVEIRTKNSQVYSYQVDFAYGTPRNPMSMEALYQKFRDCASYSAKPLSLERVEKVIELVSKLEAVNDVGRVFRLLE